MQFSDREHSIFIIFYCSEHQNEVEKSRSQESELWSSRAASATNLTATLLGQSLSLTVCETGSVILFQNYCENKINGEKWKV